MSKTCAWQPRPPGIPWRRSRYTFGERRWRSRQARSIASGRFFRQKRSSGLSACFYFDADRRRWIVARGVLRTLLGHYVEPDPSQIRFAYNAYGKPSLVGPAGDTCVCFNLSHSGEVALYTSALDRQLGVDVEYMRANVDYQGMAGRYFSPYERAVLQGPPPGEQREAFYCCWTRKEACIKAIGTGLPLPLDQFDVSLAGVPAALLASREDPQAANRWSLREMAPGAGYIGAAAVDGTDWHLSRWQ